MTAMVTTLKRTVSAAGRAFGSGFVTGFAQVTTVRGTHGAHKLPPIRSSSEALSGDWEKLGGDMRRAVDKVAPSGSRK